MPGIDQYEEQIYDSVKEREDCKVRYRKVSIIIINGDPIATVAASPSL